MEVLYRWVQNIICYMIFTAVVLNLLSSSRYEKYLHFFAGIVLILLVIQPLTGGLRLDERLAYLFESFSFQQDSADFEKRLWGMEEERLERMVRSYQEAVSLDLAAMARSEGYEPGAIQVEIGMEAGREDYGRVTWIYMQLGPEKSEQTTEASGVVQVDPIQVEWEDEGPEEKQNTDGDQKSTGVSQSGGGMDPGRVRHRRQLHVFRWRWGRGG